MTRTGQVKAAKKFLENWTGHGYEKGEPQKFWIDLLTSVFGIDAYIPVGNQPHDFWSGV